MKRIVFDDGSDDIDFPAPSGAHVTRAQPIAADYDVMRMNVLPKRKAPQPKKKKPKA
jgi:hypothetical protein